MAVFTPKSPQDFIEKLAKEGALSAYLNNLPLPAMIGCACEESGFGTSPIYQATGCPFNLQKPSDWSYPQCPTLSQMTINKEGEKSKPAPFCIATCLSDAARIWCEWILHWPNQNARTQVLASVADPKAFAANLCLVGFAESKRVKTAKFAQHIDTYKLMKYDAKAIVKDVYGLD